MDQSSENAPLYDSEITQTLDRGIIDAVCLRGVGPFLFNFVVYDIMRRTVEQCLADVILAPFARTLVDLELLLDYFWPLVCHNEELYSEMDMEYRRTTRRKRQHLAPPSQIVMKNSSLLWSWYEETV
ncbi:hypothetical protein RB195_005249 [Necator americanus]|uniref:Uncharacterized protein n=1 Tax=Necator americanus TaxID=51031 RepID=A0ABR1BLW4_NECAM